MAVEHVHYNFSFTLERLVGSTDTGLIEQAVSYALVSLLERSNRKMTIRLHMHKLYHDSRHTATHEVCPAVCGAQDGQGGLGGDTKPRGQSPPPGPGNRLVVGHGNQ